MAITIQDVALRAGVSPSTVSRVINKNHDISAETVATVENAIRHLGYRRGDTQRGRRPIFRTERTRQQTSIALLIPDTNVEAMQTLLTGKLMHGAEASARAHGFNFLLTRLAEDGGLPPCLNPIQVEGLLVRSGSIHPRAALPPLPTVWLFKPPVTPFYGDLVMPDNEVIGEMAAHYLLERGHKHLCVFSAIPTHPEARTRTESFLRTAQAEGATVFTVEGDIPAARSQRQVVAAMNTENIADRILAQAPQPTGVFLPIGDEFMEGSYRSLQNRGVRVCEDFDLIACSNDALRLQMLNPRLPNIDIRADEIGRTAAETLHWRMQHLSEHRRQILIGPRLIPGEQ